MKIEHAPQGDPCARCDAPAYKHRGSRHTGPTPRVDTRTRAERDVFLGVDGEGQTDPVTGKHRYVMLCAASETGQTWVTEDLGGLSTERCLDFLLSLPHSHAKTFAYSFGYDLTKILGDVDDLNLYRLFRPELRRRTIQSKQGERTVNVPVYWSRYSLNYLNGRFTVRKCTGRKLVRDPRTRIERYEYRFDKGRTVHDIWRFFQGKFTGALEAWKTPRHVSPSERAALLERMREMKDLRSQFDKLPRERVLSYCLDECRYMAELARKLTDAHVQAGIPLKHYFGAGSSASAMLDVMGVKDHIVTARKDNPMPAALDHAVACAFFGGRFENSVLGAVPGPVFSYDISSAYPYQLCFLPCLIHGRWEHTTEPARLKRARTALVRYRLDKSTRDRAWAPFPFRLEDGSITYPASSGGGWLWRDEYLAGKRLFRNVRFREAWLYHSECACRPFTDGSRNVPGFYVERLRIGKEGPGIVIKLGTNSCYGKTAQFIGGSLGAYTSWVWAGLITSGCRAQILDVLALHKDMGNLLMIATDGIATLERLTMPPPRDTGTHDAKDVDGTAKPLGGWEEKVIKKGLFLARPGIYFPLDPSTDDIKQVRARGIGRGVVYEQSAMIVEAWRNAAANGTIMTSTVHVKDLSRFIGVKTGITRSGLENDYKYKRSRDYGQWITRPVEMSFNPLPKREGVDGEGRLGLRRFDALESAPYRKGVVSPEARELMALTAEALEQPDGGDLTDYEASSDV